MTGTPVCVTCGHTPAEHLPVNSQAVAAVVRLPSFNLDSPTWPCLVCNCNAYRPLWALVDEDRAEQLVEGNES